MHQAQNDQPQIKVFVTKTRQFRAKIKETKNSPAYEVTIGGTSWYEGKGRKFEKQIKHKCELIMIALNTRLGRNFS